MTDPPQHIEAWRIGAEGEERVARRLAMHLERKGVELLHDRRMPLSRANLDHLAVGPGGVTVVDARNLTGKVRVISQGGLLTRRERRLRIGGRDRTKLVEGVERQIEVVRHALGELDAPGVGVAGALCFADGRGLPWRRLHVRGVLIDAPRRVAELASRTGDLHPEDVLRLRDGLARLFPAA
jgi:hypothetical protein